MVGFQNFEVPHSVAPDLLFGAVHTTMSVLLVAKPPINSGASSLRRWTGPWRASSLRSVAVCQ